MRNIFVFSSITAKIFYLIAGIVAVIVTGLTLQHTHRFKSQLDQNIEDSSLSSTEGSADEIGAVIESTSSQVLSTISNLDVIQIKEGRSAEIKKLLSTDGEMISLTLFYLQNGQLKALVSEETPKNGKTEARFETSDHLAVKNRAKATAKLVAEAFVNSALNLKSSEVRNVSPEIGLPTYALVNSIAVNGSPKDRVISVSIMWQTRILVALPKGRSTTTTIVDANGDVFSSFKSSETLRRVNLKTNTLVKNAVQHSAPNGYVKSYKDANGTSMLGAFSQVRSFPELYVILERDSNSAFTIITKAYVSALLWASLFLLIAFFIAYASAQTATRPIRALVQSTREIAGGNFNVRVQPQSNDEISLLAYSVNDMASRIKDLMTAQIQQARHEKELETARMVQSTFFPKRAIKDNCFSVTGFYEPATECGGDLWGHFNVSPNKQLLFIADAMGHGAPAALVTAIGYATCQAVVAVMQDVKGIDPSPSILLQRLNRIIFDAVEGKISMTFFAMLFDFETGQYVFANAGHNFPVIITKNREDQRLSKAAKSKVSPSYIIPLQLQGTPLGIDRVVEFKERNGSFEPGDKIFMFTDGLIENSSPGKEPLGRKNLIEYLASIGDQNSNVIKEGVLAYGRQCFGNTSLSDDVTIVVAEVDSNWEKSSNKLSQATPTFALNNV
jgi:serine phosphatase RsbU (regulator of sigma subunit)